MLVVGSTALDFHGIPWRKPKDLDLIGTRTEFDEFLTGPKWVRLVGVRGDKRILESKTGMIEFEIAQNGNTAEELLQIVEPNVNLSKIAAMTGVYNADPSVILALKLSHRYLKNNPYFLKTMNDIIELRELGYKVPEELKEWLKKREKETYAYKHPSLNRNKENFFKGDNVPYIYEHDDIHEAVKHSYAPAYSFFQKEGAEVTVSKEKWDQLSNGEWGRQCQLWSVLEESYVLALERCLIPNKFTYPPRRAFIMALEKVCTSITSGWWREYAWEHYHQAVGLYNADYVEKFEHALAAGKIRSYQGEKA